MVREVRSNEKYEYIKMDELKDGKKISTEQETKSVVATKSTFQKIGEFFGRIGEFFKTPYYEVRAINRVSNLFHQAKVKDELIKLEPKEVSLLKNAIKVAAKDTKSLDIVEYYESVKIQLNNSNKISHNAKEFNSGEKARVNSACDNIVKAIDSLILREEEKEKVSRRVLSHTTNPGESILRGENKLSEEEKARNLQFTPRQMEIRYDSIDKADRDNFRKLVKECVKKHPNEDAEMISGYVLADYLKKKNARTLQIEYFENFEFDEKQFKAYKKAPVRWEG